MQMPQVQFDVGSADLWSVIAGVDLVEESCRDGLYSDVESEASSILLTSFIYLWTTLRSRRMERVDV